MNSFNKAINTSFGKRMQFIYFIDRNMRFDSFFIIILHVT